MIAAVVTFGLSIALLTGLGTAGGANRAPSTAPSGGDVVMARTLRGTWPDLVRRAYAADHVCFDHLDPDQVRRAVLRPRRPGSICVSRFRSQVAMMGQVADALTSQPLQGRLSTAVAHLAAALAANLARDQPLLTAMATGSAARATHLLQQPLPPPICIGDVNEAIEGPDTVAEKDEPTADPLARFPYTDC